MTYTAIELVIDRFIATLTLNRPDKMNALNDDLLLEMQHALDALERNTEVRAVIITGAGRAFSAGFDISPREKPFTTIQDWRDHVKLGNDTWFKIWRSRLPFVAAVNGFCLGGGCDLSMVCDITIAADTAQFGEPEIQFQSAPPFPITTFPFTTRGAPLPPWRRAAPRPRESCRCPRPAGSSRRPPSDRCW